MCWACVISCSQGQVSSDMLSATLNMPLVGQRDVATEVQSEGEEDASGIMTCKFGFVAAVLMAE